MEIVPTTTFIYQKLVFSCLFVAFGDGGCPPPPTTIISFFMLEKPTKFLSFSLSLTPSLLAPASRTRSPEVHTALRTKSTVSVVLHLQRVRARGFVGRLRLPDQAVGRVHRHQVPVLLQDQAHGGVGLARARRQIDRPQVVLPHVEHQGAVRQQDEPEQAVLGMQLFHLDAALLGAHRRRVRRRGGVFGQGGAGVRPREASVVTSSIGVLSDAGEARKTKQSAVRNTDNNRDPAIMVGARGGRGGSVISPSK